MARRDVTHKEAFAAIRANLMSRLGLHDRQAMMLIAADVPTIPIGVEGDAETYYGISPGAMDYQDFAGHPMEHCTVDAGVNVLSVSRIWTDDANSHDGALFHEDRGLLIIQAKLIAAMVAPFAELALNDASGDTFLHDTMRPVGSAQPQEGIMSDPDGEAEDIPVYFQINRFIATYDLKLSS